MLFPPAINKQEGKIMNSKAVRPAAPGVAASSRANHLAVALIATTALVAPALAHASSSDDTSTPQAATTPPPADSGLAEIIVTAQKRSENMQTVPVAITAISANDALRQGMTGTDSLTAAVPGLVMTNPANVGNPYLRGVGSALFDPSSEQSVALYIDGVYISAPESNIFSFNNIKSIEILKGPQGTLFGRNATGGVIQITTRDPSFAPHADVSLGYGNYDDFVGSAYLTGGLSDNLAMDFSGRYENQADGYGRDLTTGAKTFQEAIGNYALRSKILFKPTTTTTITLAGDYSHSVETNAYQKPQGTVSPLDGSTYPGPFNTYDDLNDRNTVNTGGGSLKIEQDVGDIKLTDILAYRKTKVHYDLDDDVSSVPAADIILNPTTHNWSEEIQLAGPNRGWLKWIVGGYYYNAYGGYDSVVIDGSEQVSDNQKVVSYAGFGQVTGTVLPKTDVTLGIRYTTEDQTFTLIYPVALTLKQSANKVTYRAAVDYHFSSDVSGYVSFNTGFKSGGYNLLAPGNNFQPETLTAYEVGLKSEMFDRHLRVNLAGYYYDDKNVQVLNSYLGGTVTSNAAAATYKGVEADFQLVPVEHLSVSGGLSIQTGKFTRFPDGVVLTSSGVLQPPTDLSGNKTPITPPVTGDLSVSYKARTALGTIEPSVTLVYNDGFFWQADNRLTQPAYTLLNASVGFTTADQRYDVRVWGKNLTNATYYVARLGTQGTGDVQEQAAPRTFGVTVSVHY